MQETLTKFWEQRDRRAKGDEGFTLIELLVVVVILGVLIAIAIPLYLNYRKGANDAAAESDLRNAISVMEVCNSTNNAYPTQTTAGLAAPVVATSCPGQTVNLSTGTALNYISAAAGVSYVLTGTNSGGTTTKYYCYNSSKGGSVKEITAALGSPVTLASC